MSGFWAGWPHCLSLCLAGVPSQQSSFGVVRLPTRPLVFFQSKYSKRQKEKLLFSSGLDLEGGRASLWPCSVGHSRGPGPRRRLPSRGRGSEDVPHRRDLPWVCLVFWTPFWPSAFADFKLRLRGNKAEKSCWKISDLGRPQLEFKVIWRQQGWD